MSNNGKFMNLTGGVPSLETGATTGGNVDAGKIPALDPSGRLTMAMMPVGVANEAATAPASEAIAAGALINLWSNGGVLNMRNADSSVVGKPAHGFILAAVASGATGQYFLPGSTNTGVSGRTIGATEFLGTVGAVTETAPTTSGSVVQQVGVASSATALVFNPQAPIAIS